MACHRQAGGGEEGGVEGDKGGGREWTGRRVGCGRGEHCRGGDARAVVT